MRIDRLQALNPDFSMNGIGTDNNNNPTPLGQQQGVRQTVQDNTVQQQANPAPVQQPINTQQATTDIPPIDNAIVYSDKETTQNGTTNQSATTSVRTTTPDTTEVVQAGYKDYDTNIANPTEQAYAKYKQQADALYSLLNPYNPEPIKQSRDLAQLQALVTAFNDLGKALGKDIGNSEGLGIVTVDKSNYDNLRKEALKYRDAYNQALQQKGIAEMNRQMQFLQQELANKNANIKGRYQAGQQAKKDFESKNYDQTKSGQTTTDGQSRTRTMIDPNSEEYKQTLEALAIKRAGLELQKKNVSLKQQSINFKKQETARKNAENGEVFVSPFYNNPHYNPDETNERALGYKTEKGMILFDDVSEYATRDLYHNMLPYLQKSGEYKDKNGNTQKYRVKTKLKEIRADLNQIAERSVTDSEAYNAYRDAINKSEAFLEELGLDEIE